jgi:hypothetical protein
MQKIDQTNFCAQCQITAELSKQGIRIDIVVYRPVTKRWLCKQQPFLGNSLVNTFLLLGSRFLIKPQLDYNNENGVFLCGSCQGIILKTIGATQLVLYGSLCRDDFSAWSWRISTVRSCCQGTAGENTAGWKILSGCCGDMGLVEIGCGAVITCTYKSCV